MKAFELSQRLREKWFAADHAAKRRIFKIVCLKWKLVGVTLCPEMRKPFDAVAEGLTLKIVGATRWLLNFSWPAFGTWRQDSTISSSGWRKASDCNHKVHRLAGPCGVPFGEKPPRRRRCDVRGLFVNLIAALISQTAWHAVPVQCGTMDSFGMNRELMMKGYLMTKSLLAVFRYSIALFFDLGT